MSQRAASTDSTRRGAKEASIHTIEITTIKLALKEIHEREDKRWVIYKQTNKQSSIA